jgi:N-acetylglucosaminyl-diphospho-decaprenol L-rhamnosyltransferase
MPDTTHSSNPITVSIVSHGQQALLLPLLEQLQTYSADSIAQVIVVVNIPEPDLLGDRQWLFPVIQLRNAAPQGFGANHNLAFKHCTTPWFLVLNPDMRLQADVLSSLLKLAEDDTGVLAPRVHEPGHDGPQPHRALITPWEILRRHAPSYAAPRQPAWIPGMFMLFRALTYRQLKGFDARYYMYGEDFDICARLRLQGWQILIAENLHVEHLAQRASRRNWQHLRWHFTSLTLVWISAAFWRYRRLRSQSLLSHDR